MPHRADPSPLAGAIFETIREPLLILDGGLRVESANPAFFRHFRVSTEETLGRSLFELGDGQWNVPALRELLESVLPEHREVEDFQVDHVFPAVGRRIMLVNAREVPRDEAGGGHVLVALEDITARWRAERASRRYARELERSNRELEEFAHAASHDLQEPLRKVRVFTDRLATALASGATREVVDGNVDRIRSAAQRMQTRIDDLLKLARVSREPPRYGPVDLETTVTGVFKELQAALPDVEARLVTEGLREIQADPLRLELLFQNLLGNAIKYRHPGRSLVIQVGAEEAPPPPADARRWVHVSVQDNGIGFDPVYAERIFGAFQRLHGRSEYEGSGVGLAICRRLVELHGGTIGATAVPGEGARFDVLLPMTQEISHDR